MFAQAMTSTRPTTAMSVKSSGATFLRTQENPLAPD